MGKVQGHRKTLLPSTAVHGPRHEMSVAVWIILAVALDIKSGCYVNYLVGSESCQSDRLSSPLMWHSLGIELTLLGLVDSVLPVECRDVLCC